MIAIILKADLVHGAYYQGRCRNATIARWNADKQCFTHWRTKFSSVFLEDIKHPDDEQRFDVFYPYVLISVPEQEIPFDALTRIEQMQAAKEADAPTDPV